MEYYSAIKRRDITAWMKEAKHKDHALFYSIYMKCLGKIFHRNKIRLGAAYGRETW